VYYDYIFRQPEIAAGPPQPQLRSSTTTGCLGPRPEAGQTPVEDTAGMQSICSQLQKIQLLTNRSSRCGSKTASGRRSTTATGTNWPSSTGNQVQPATWNGYWQMGAIFMLTNIKPVAH